MAYNGRCTGKLIAFLGEYWTVTHAHSVIFMGDGKTIRDRHDEGPIVATYEWKDDTDIPLFTFTEKWYSLNQVQYDQMDEVIKLFGYRRLHPEDKQQGCSGIYVEHVDGILNKNPKPSKLLPEEEHAKRMAKLKEQIKGDREMTWSPGNQKQAEGRLKRPRSLHNDAGKQ